MHGFTQNETLEAIVDAQMATQDWGSAKQLVNPLLQSMYVSKTQFKGINSGQIQALIRSAEMRGHGNGPEMADWLQKFTQLYVLSGGTLDYNQIAGMSRQGFSALTSQTFGGMASLEPVMQVMRGQPFGTALAGLQKTLSGSTIAGSTMPKVASFFEGLGLWDAKGGGKHGKLKSNYMSDVRHDFPGFMINTLIPAIEKKYHYDSKTKEGRDQISALFSAFNQNQNRLFTLFITQLPKILNTRAMLPHLQTLPQMVAEAHQTPSGSLKDLSAAWHNFSIEIGKTVTPIIIPALVGLTSALEHLAKYIPNLKTVGNMLGSKIYDVVHPNHGNGIYNQLTGLTSPTSNNKSVNLFGNVILDSKKVGKFIAKSLMSHLDKNGAPQSPSGWNVGMQIPSTATPLPGTIG